MYDIVRRILMLITIGRQRVKAKFQKMSTKFNNCIAELVEVGARDVQGLPLLAHPTPRQSYAPIAIEPVPSSYEPPCQWYQSPVKQIYQWKNKGGRGEGWR